MVHIKDEILSKVTKPARYTGGEVNQVIKNPKDVKVRFAMCFPDVYEVGMSHLGIRILYHKINDREDCYCERAFAPWVDMEELMRKNDIPLFTLETKSPLKDFDFVGFTLQYEMSYTNVINMLNLGKIPLMSKDRGDDDPFIIFGGPCAYNPEPLADMGDIFVLGEAEEVIDELLDLYINWKESKKDRKEFLVKAASCEGIYVPSLYDIEYNEDGTIKRRIPLKSGIPDKIRKRFIKDLNESYFPEKMIVPLTEIVHDRIMLETFRGCTRGCRFCQAGMIYRPVREKKVDKLMEFAEKLLKSTGYDEISLTSLSICDYSDIKNLVLSLIEKYEKDRVSISLPSLRIDSFSVDLINEIQKVRKTGLTFAPEAGTQRMRDIINKGVTEEDLIKSVRSAFESGWSTIKLYFMIGLPYETMEDVEGIAHLGQKVVDTYFSIPKDKRNKGLNVTLSTSCFVPKPFTPFQWKGQDTTEMFIQKQQYLKDKIKSRYITYNWHEPSISFLEAVFSRGDRRLSKVLIKAVEKGCKFDGWQELFKYDAWMEAFRECNIDPHFYATRERNIDEVLPWDFIDIGVSKEYLKNELRKAQKGELTRDCRLSCTGCGITGFTKEVKCFNGAIFNKVQ
ncbi:TIGR03960 family B12-binding radical SAM protein [Caloramator sp. E03]|uniref:TIGR03960 family B12-binding radical SAM protein n=1 Tax=Caloramator sp. E03 TaxID=2576307 RepID=UPI0011101CD8|nr:TIGR03960 family B12-binding radical SAM protein [Caloramator sp. E03]QCX32483.1 TIGR03960 family B12-binding radical SAM protein [Caloramator sp. E03]